MTDAFTLNRTIDNANGKVSIALNCFLWVYNCTEVALAFQTVSDSDAEDPNNDVNSSTARWFQPCSKHDTQGSGIQSDHSTMFEGSKLRMKPKATPKSSAAIANEALRRA